jgi:hypothetical protein
MLKNKKANSVQLPFDFLLINSSRKLITNSSFDAETSEYNTYQTTQSITKNKLDHKKKLKTINNLQNLTSRTKQTSFLDVSKETNQDIRLTEPSRAKLYKNTTNNIGASKNIFYKLLKRSKIKEKLDKNYLSKQTENFNNIKQTITKKKFSICNLGNRQQENKQKSPAKQVRGSCRFSEPYDKTKSNQDLFLTNLGRIQKRYTKRTTIGRSTIILHSSLRLSDRFSTGGDRKLATKMANEYTIKNNNNIKVLCFNSNANPTFTFQDVNHDDHSLRKKSYYNSQFKNITVDKDYQRVQKLQNKINTCTIRAYSNKINSTLPKIK